MTTNSRAHVMAVSLILLCWTTVLRAEPIRRNFSWSLEGRNEPILQMTNQSSESRQMQIRLIFGNDSYRYPVPVSVPAGENEFLRVSDVVAGVSRRYPEIKNNASGLLQVEFEGASDDMQLSLINLNPRTGLSGAGRETGEEPALRSVEPESGDPAGGTVVTILGDNFDDSTTVRFGGVPALRTRQSDGVLIAIAPPHAPGDVDVEVFSGKRKSLLKSGFRYETAGPEIYKLEPADGPTGGGTRVVIQGANFQRQSRVMWDGNPVQARFQGSQQLSVIAPEGRTGSVAVEVVNPDGKKFVLPDAFSYKGAPQITGVTPQSGSASGGYTVTINGANFEEGYSVLFEGQYAPTTFINPRALAAVVPPGKSGTADITVSSPSGQTDTLERAFLYNEPPAIVSIDATPNPIVRYTTSTIVVEATDPEAELMEYEYRLAYGPSGSQIAANGEQAIFFSANATGTAVIQVTVLDPHGARAQANIEIIVE